MTECTQCKRRFRADQLIKEQTRLETEGLSLQELYRLQTEKNVRCPECGGLLGPPQHFLTMFKTSIGPYGEDPAYGRPEAAQGIFVNFKRIFEVMREKLPIGVAQVGTVLRNEISPRQGPIRLREFTIMDFELFFDPEDSKCPFLSDVADDGVNIVTEKTRREGKGEATGFTIAEALSQGTIKTQWAAYFMALSKRFLTQLGVDGESQRFFEKLPGERAHYSVQTFDHEVRLDRWGWVEVAGFAYRTDFDLRKHMDATGVDMQVFKPYAVPIERKHQSIKLRHDRIRQTFGNDAGKVASLLSKQDPSRIGQHQKQGFVEIEGYRIPIDCFEIREEVVKESGGKFIPHVVEPSFGVERLVYTALEYNLKMKGDRVVLSLPFRIAPLQVSVLPLMNRDGLPEKAVQVHRLLLNDGFRADYDESGSIGRRYARADETGVSIDVTIDYDTLKDDTVTLRDRDSWSQIRARVSDLKPTIKNILERGFSPS